MRKISIITLVLAVVMIANQSCTKTYFDINKDLNNVTSGTVTYDVVLPAALGPVIIIFLSIVTLFFTGLSCGG